MLVGTVGNRAKQQKLKRARQAHNFTTHLQDSVSAAIRPLSDADRVQECIVRLLAEICPDVRVPSLYGQSDGILSSNPTSKFCSTSTSKAARVAHWA